MIARWNRYWFAPGGQTSAAVLRIAIATSVLWTLWRLGSGYAGDPDAAPHGIYRAVGILRLYPGEPGGGVLAVLRVVAWGSTLAMLLGVRTRLATAVSLVSALALASYGAAFTASWSHDNNAPFLAQIAFLGAHGGDVLSVDAWWRRRRGLPAPPGHAYQWSVRLVQLAVALMFASGAVSKLIAGRMSLAWALSDNLRHQLLVRFDLIGVPRTPAAEWLLAAAWRWKAAAVGNLVSQLAPLGACFAINRPRLRAALGAVFVLEVIGLGLVMDFWDVHWLPLAAAFVDWDRLAAWVRARRGGVAPAAAAAPIVVGRGARIFVGVFVLYDAVVAFVPTIDQRLNTYPFSAFPMFAQVRAKRPYDEHQTYELAGGRIVVEAEPPLGPAQQAMVDGHHTYRMLYRERSPDVLRARLAALFAAAQGWFPGHAIRAVRVDVVSVQAPAYPARARLERWDLATVGELRADGTFRTLLGAIDAGRERWTITPAPVGLALDGLALAAHLDNRPDRTELAATRDGDRFVVDAPPPRAATVHVVGRVTIDGGDRWFLIGQRGR